eukprot:TRINITY_DN56055_c0_g1_i1.p1 TRINITY_DN56055_c0_g1~~TRINITY_DN56055_c0_g1_i1.p1  ORF type:complete len:181 (+),score=44.09 TRINITY_DN56055_c0_g1_i1:45-587(+)
MFEKVVIIDCRAHMLGRLASIIAKELLNGQHVVCVRTEEINISGSLFRNQLKWAVYMHKSNNVNPRRGPYHFRAPSRMLFRVIRGMIPHKTARGAAALQRLKVFEGVPTPYDKMKRVVVPDALRVTRLKPGRPFCVLGDLATKAGWKHQDLIKRLEDKRKVRSDAYYQKKKAAIAAKASA